MVSVYLSNEEILAVSGAKNGRHLSRVCSGILPEGCLRNGVVVNEAAFADGLSRFWTENMLPKKNVRLVLGGNRAVLRPVELPQAKEKQTRTMVRQEMSDITESGAAPDLIDYMTLRRRPGQSGQRLMCAAIEPGVVQSMSEQFARAGISLSVVTTELLAVMTLLVPLKVMKERTTALLMMDSDNVRVLLLNKGMYKYTGTSRTFGQPGSTEYADEVVQVLRSARQFQSAERGTDPLTQIYYINLAPENQQTCLQAMQAAGFECQPLPEIDGVRLSGEKGPFLSRWAYCVGALMEPKGWHLVNFLRDDRKKDEQELQRRRRRMQALPYVAIALIGAAVFGVITADNLRMQGLIDLNNEYLNSESTIAGLQEHDYYYNGVQNLNQQLAALERFETARLSYPLLSSEVLARIRACGGSEISVNVTGFTASSGLVQFEASSANVIDIPAYVRSLVSTGLFQNVSYSGYGYQSALQSYTINVQCYLNAGVGREG